jgi:signal transduction histidine kinase
MLGDPRRLQQVFRNLLENSLNACQDPVRITITCEETSIDDRPALSLWVSDNGPGLTVEQRRKIFDPFYTTRSSGVGLGMAIVRRIVEAHEGQIIVGSGGPGAEFRISLPREGNPESE